MDSYHVSFLVKIENIWKLTKKKQKKSTKYTSKWRLGNRQIKGKILKYYHSKIRHNIHSNNCLHTKWEGYHIHDITAHTMYLGKPKQTKI